MNKYDSFMKRYNLKSNCRCKYCKRRDHNIDNDPFDKKYYCDEIKDSEENHKYLIHSDYKWISRESKRYKSDYSDCYWVSDNYNSNENIEKNFEDIFLRIIPDIPLKNYILLKDFCIYSKESSIHDYYERGDIIELILDIRKFVDKLEEMGYER